LHVLDHCDALNCIIEKGIPGEIYNIGGGTELNNLDLAKLLLSSLGKNDRYINFVPDRKGHDFRYSVNYEKIAINCGYKPSRIFQESINETIEWYRKNESWWRPLKETKN
jgi:dTDP-glucose 4,6-dehydratase